MGIYGDPPRVSAMAHLIEAHRELVQHQKKAARLTSVLLELVGEMNQAERELYHKLTNQVLVEEGVEDGI